MQQQIDNRYSKVLAHFNEQVDKALEELQSLQADYEIETHEDARSDIFSAILDAEYEYHDAVKRRDAVIAID